jgi:riboflavin kinase/FMN adenylyltransferase
LYADDEPAPPALRGAAIALGSFDGVHKGHQAVVAAARAAAHERGLSLGAGVFEPHPRQVFRPEDPPFRLQSPGQRARALGALGVETVFQIKFDRALAGLTDSEFARAVLHDKIGAAHVVVGFDFQFGRGRMGDAASLTRLGQSLGFTVSVVEAVADAAGPKISSSAIRAAIGEGRVEAARDWLGRPWAIEGIVGPGAARGRTIGFPTANVGLGAYVRPRFGVYAVRVRLDDDTCVPGVANCGVKPTVAGEAEPLLEAHLFDFSGDLYGRRIEVEFIAFLRDERKFENFDALVAQIKADAAQARALLA